jgi:hypothetical protein
MSNSSELAKLRARVKQLEREVSELRNRPPYLGPVLIPTVIPAAPIWNQPYPCQPFQPPFIIACAASKPPDRLIGLIDEEKQLYVFD